MAWGRQTQQPGSTSLLNNLLFPEVKRKATVPSHNHPHVPRYPWSFTFQDFPSYFMSSTRPESPSAGEEAKVYQSCSEPRSVSAVI